MGADYFATKENRLLVIGCTSLGFLQMDRLSI